MLYKNKSLLPDERSQITVTQRQNEEQRHCVIVYKGCLKHDEVFSFKSQRLIECPFNIKIYVDRRTDAHLWTCCEHKHRLGGLCLGQSFTVMKIDKAIPCRRCQRRLIDLQRPRSSQTMALPNSVTAADENSLMEKRRATLGRNEDDFVQVESEEHASGQASSGERDKTSPKSIGSDGHGALVLPSVPSFQSFLLGSSPSSAVGPSATPATEQQPNRRWERANDPQPGHESSDDDVDSMCHSFRQEMSSRGRSLPPLVLPAPCTAQERQWLTPRNIGNVEDFVMITLGVGDGSMQNRPRINFVKSFGDTQQMNSFVETLDAEKIILIADATLRDSIQNPSRFDFIFFYSKDGARANDDPAAHPCFASLESIFDELDRCLRMEENLLSVRFLSASRATQRAFSYSQLLKETLLMEDQEADLKKDLVDFARLHYRDNAHELRLIDEFEKDFSADKSIWWFTRQSFIRKMLTRALRTQEIDILYKTRWLVQALHGQMTENRLTATVYRLYYCSLAELNMFQECGFAGFVSFGAFLDGTVDQPSVTRHVNTLETILFRVRTTSAVDIRKLRHPESNGEVLLPFDGVYVIERIEQHTGSDGAHWWLVDLTDGNHKLIDVMNELRQEVRAPSPLIQLGKLLIANDDYAHADWLTRSLSRDGSMNGNPASSASLAALHHLLGSLDNRLGYYRAARLQFETALQTFLTFIPEDSPVLSATYNNIGSMFYQEDQHEHAIACHLKALQCQLGSSSPDVEAVATYSANIGAVYLDQGKYDQALLHYKHSLRILQRISPDEGSQSMATVYDRIASVYWEMDEPVEALAFYEKALQLELKYLPDGDHKISVSYFNLSAVYAKLNRLDEAIECAEKSVQQLLKSVPMDHPEVKENTTLLEGLRRRKWLQRLYA